MRNKSSLQPVLTGLPVATASLYVLGVCFYQGFMRTVGLEETQFPLTVDRTLFHGFFALLNLSAAQIGYFVLASEIIAVVAFVIVLLSSSAKVRNAIGAWFTRKPTQEKRNEALEPPQEIADFASFAGQMFVFSAVVLFAILGILLAGIFADKSGQATANNFLKKVEGGKEPAVDVSLVGQDQPITAYTILCSSTHCAFLINKKTVVYRHEKIDNVITHNMAVNTDAAR